MYISRTLNAAIASYRKCLQLIIYKYTTHSHLEHMAVIKYIVNAFSLRVNPDKIDVLQDNPTDVLENLEKMHASLNELREAYGYDRIDKPYADEPIFTMGTQFGPEGGYDINEE